MKSKKKLPLLFGTLAAGVVCLTLGVGVLGATPVPQTPLQQTTASPLGLNPETDPVIMTTADGLEIKLGGALTNTNLSGYAYFTTSGKDGTVNWVIIGYNGNISGQYPDGADSITVNTFDKYATIEGHSDYTRSVDTITDQPLSQSPLKDAFSDNQEILSEISGDNVTYYKVNYFKQFEKTLSEFTNAIVADPNGNDQQKAAAQDLKEPGQLLCLSENILFKEHFKASGDRSGNMYSSGYKLYDAMNAIADSTSYDYGLDSLGLYNENTNPNGKIMPQTLYTNYSTGSPVTVFSKKLENQYVFPLAQSKYAGTSNPEVTQNFIVETYLNTSQLRIAYYNGSASYWWLRSGLYNDSSYACNADNNGTFSYSNVDHTLGVRPAFVMDLSPKSYNITFNLNGGTGVDTGPITLPAGAELPTPTNGDMIFEGWYLGTDDTTTYTHVSKSFGANNSNITLTAKWAVPQPFTTFTLYDNSSNTNINGKFYCTTGGTYNNADVKWLVLGAPIGKVSGSTFIINDKSGNEKLANSTGYDDALTSGKNYVAFNMDKIKVKASTSPEVGDWSFDNNKFYYCITAGTWTPASQLLMLSAECLGTHKFDYYTSSSDYDNNWNNKGSGTDYSIAYYLNGGSGNEANDQPLISKLNFSETASAKILSTKITTTYCQTTKSSGGTYNDVTNCDGTNTYKLFLLDRDQIYKPNNVTNGTSYGLNAALGLDLSVSNNSLFIGYNGSSASYWWLRSGYYYNSDCACGVGNVGSLGSDVVFSYYGVRPAFVLKI